jgi:hypothetical protein
MREKPDPKALSDDDLLCRLSEILRQSRRIEADLVAHIAEVDARRLWAREAVPSMFAYCVEVLHLSEPEAGLRIHVARATREHPMLLAMLGDGRMHLSGIALLAPLLTRQNRTELLRRAAHKSKRELRELVAELIPQPNVRTTMRKLPTVHTGDPRPADHSSGGDVLAPAPAGHRLDGIVPATSLHATLFRAEHRPDDVKTSDATPIPRPVRQTPAPLPRSTRPTTLEPLAPARYKVQFTADAELRDQLERLQVLMRSSVPDGDLGRIIKVAVTEKLERLEARRFGKTKKPRKRLGQTDTRAKSRHIPAAVRRFVEKRDGGRCTYRDKHGRRCTKRHDLEFHHRAPFGRGGDHSPTNVALACATHNALMAEHDYGKEVMARFRRSGSLVSEPAAVYAIGSPRPPRSSAGQPAGAHRRLGFERRPERLENLAVTGP